MSIFYLQKSGTLQPLFKAKSHDQALLLIHEQDRDCLRYSAEAVLINPYSGEVKFASQWDDQHQQAGILCPASYCIVTEHWYADADGQSPFSSLSIELWIGSKQLFEQNVDTEQFQAALTRRLESRFPGASIAVRLSDGDELILDSANIAVHEWFGCVSAVVWLLADEALSSVRSKRAPNLNLGVIKSPDN